MTFEEIAAALGVPTPEAVAKALGVEPASIRASSPEPVLVLDYRGGEGARSWARVAKGEIVVKKMKTKLDPRTGLKVEKRRR